MIPNFLHLPINPILKIQQFPLSMLIEAKICLILYPLFENSTTHIAIPMGPAGSKRPFLKNALSLKRGSWPSSWSLSAKATEAKVSSRRNGRRVWKTEWWAKLDGSFFQIYLSQLTNKNSTLIMSFSLDSTLASKLKDYTLASNFGARVVLTLL